VACGATGCCASVQVSELKVVGTAAPLRRRPSAAARVGESPRPAGGEAVTRDPAHALAAAGDTAPRSPAPRHSKGESRPGSSDTVSRRVVQRTDRAPHATVQRDGVPASREQQTTRHAPEEAAEDARPLTKQSHPATRLLPNGGGEMSHGGMQHQDQPGREPADRQRGDVVVKAMLADNAVSSASASGDRVREEPHGRRTDAAAATGSCSVSSFQHGRARAAEQQTVVTADLRLTCSIPNAAEHGPGVRATDSTAAESSDECPQVGFRSLLEQACRVYRLVSREGAGSVPNTSS